MPAVNEKQRRLFAVAKALKEGKIQASKVTGAARHIARTLSKAKISEFTRKVKNPKNAHRAAVIALMK